MVSVSASEMRRSSNIEIQLMTTILAVVSNDDSARACGRIPKIAAGSLADMEVEERVQGGAAIRQIPAVAFVIALLSAAARVAGLQIAARPESNPPSDRRESGVSRRRRYAPDFPPLASARPLLLLAFWLSRLLRGQARGSPRLHGWGACGFGWRGHAGHSDSTWRGRF